MTTEDLSRPNPQELTPGPWKWEFVGNAGNYFLVGNGGKGPITFSGPDSADGRLKQAAPALLAIAQMVNDKIIPEIEDFAGPSGIIHVPLSRAEVEAIRAAIAAVEGGQDIMKVDKSARVCYNISVTQENVVRINL